MQAERTTRQSRAARKKATPGRPSRRARIGVVLAIVLSLTLVSARRSLHAVHVAGADRGLRRRRRAAGRRNGDARIGSRTTRRSRRVSRCSRSTPRSTRSRWTGRSPTSPAPASRSAPAAQPSMRQAPICVAARAAERQGTAGCHAACAAVQRGPRHGLGTPVEGAQATRDQAQAQVTAAEADIQQGHRADGR